MKNIEDFQKKLEREMKSRLVALLILPGEGLHRIKAGDDIDAVLKMFGIPEDRVDNERTIWLNYLSKESIDFLISNYTHMVQEIRFNEGYFGELENGLSLGDDLYDVFLMEGTSIQEFNLTTVSIDYSPLGGNRVLYLVEDKDGTTVSYKLMDERKGVLYWASSSRTIKQIVVFEPVQENGHTPFSIDVYSEYHMDVFTID